VADAAKEVPVRVAALRVLADRKAKGSGDALLLALRDPSPELRAEARDLFAARDPVNGSAILAAVLNDSSAKLVERQRAIDALARIKSKTASAALDEWAVRLGAGLVEPELQLDVLEAAKSASTPARKKTVAKFEATLPSGPHGKFAVSLHGGDADRGREIFTGHAAAQCIRCHTVNGSGGNAGPDLSKVASKYPEKTREYFLQSLLDPGAKLAPGFGTVSLSLIDGRVLSGTIVTEDKKSLTLQTADGKKEMIPLGDIERRSAAASPMPAVDKTLTPREVRDLVEYLATLR
jgi:putative heme-binding domain-containing protein